jgi:hypothetical protein
MIPINLSTLSAWHEAIVAAGGVSRFFGDDGRVRTPLS